MEFWLHTVLVLAVSAVTVLGRQNGAPVEACNSLMPAGHTSPANMATGDVPFYVNTSYIGDYYVPGGTRAIVLSPNSTNMDFRGFIIQARTVADDSPVGQFVIGNSTDQQALCDGDTAVTHVNANEKTMVRLYWTAPMEGTGAIMFRYAFVDNYQPGTSNMFWAGLETPMIGEGNATTPTPTATATQNVTMVTANVTMATVTVTPTVTTTPGGDGGGSSGLVAGTMLILLLSTIITLIN